MRGVIPTLSWPTLPIRTPYINLLCWLLIHKLDKMQHAETAEETSCYTKTPCDYNIRLKKKKLFYCHDHFISSDKRLFDDSPGCLQCSFKMRKMSLMCASVRTAPRGSKCVATALNPASRNILTRTCNLSNRVIRVPLLLTIKT